MRVPTQRATRKSANECSAVPIFADDSVGAGGAQSLAPVCQSVTSVDLLDAALAACGRREAGL